MMKIYSNGIKNEKGAAILATMITLMALTVIGIAATRMTSFENADSGTQKRKQAAFYAAEAGLEHGKAIVNQMMADDNIKKKFDENGWDFILDGKTTVDGSTLAKAKGTDFTDGVPLLSNVSFFNGKYTYNVRIWNNEEDNGGAEDDTDNTVTMRSQAEGKNGEFAAVEISLGAGMGDGRTRIAEENIAQKHGGPMKQGSSNDVEAVVTQQADGTASYQLSG
ncbi:MAG: pilus assembly PilX N-terminal domain-containing protein [Desulfococcaceae bacterium]|jgi:hypothetical protein|nr:pilus assembly PilX N-terminal domain-containing protein [Desulfococcaceae bacterium]